MAKCPNCSYKLKIWNIKAECPECKVNIPNYNWEQRLEEDAIRSEKAFTMLNERKKNFKACLFGNKLRIVRFILTFSPLVLLLIPFIKVTLNIPFLADDTNISVFNTILWIVGNSFDFESVFSLLSSNILGTTAILFYGAIVSFLFAFLIAVVSFFLLMIRSVSLGNIGNIVCNVFSVVLCTLSIILFSLSFPALESSGINFIINPVVGTAPFIGILLYTANLILNILTEKTVKTERHIFKKKRETIGKI